MKQDCAEKQQAIEDHISEAEVGAIILGTVGICSASHEPMHVHMLGAFLYDKFHILKFNYSRHEQEIRSDTVARRVLHTVIQSAVDI